MSPKTKKILQVILSILMIVSVFLPWYNYQSSADVNIGGMSMGYNTGNRAVAGNIIGENWLMVVVSIIAIILIFTKFKFTFILGILNLGLTITSILLWKDVGSGVNMSLSAEGINASASLTNSFGPYMLIISSILFTIISVDFKQLSLAKELSPNLNENDDIIVSAYKNTTNLENPLFDSQINTEQTTENIKQLSQTVTQQKNQTCSKCKTLFSINAKFCPNCGSPSILEIFCTNCGTKLSSGEKFCSSCGHPVIGKPIDVKKEIDLSDL